MNLIKLVIRKVFMLFVKRRFYRSSSMFIESYYRIKGYNKISIGTKFYANRFLRIEVFGNINTPKLIIGNNVSLGESVHIAVNNKIIIKDNVLIRSRVLITDHNHGSYNGNDQASPIVPPKLREISKNKLVEIGENVWIGDGVIILPGSAIGSGSIIGANTVISSSVPSNCIVAGSPFKIIKRYNELSSTWEKV